MTIIIVNGSPRREGVTSVILKDIRNELVDKGAEVVYYDLSEIRVSHCMGCMACFKTGHCHIDDDMELISEEIASADGLVIGSPTYASNVTGLTKDFIDRGHFVMEQMLHDKHCIIVTTGINYGREDAARVLKRLVVYSGGYLSSVICENIPFNESILAKKKSARKSVHAAAKLIRDISQNKKTLFQRMFNLIVFHIGIKPFVLKNREKYNGVINKWTQYGR